MARLHKQQIQLLQLGAVLLIIFGALIYAYRGRLLPKPEPGSVAVASPRLNLPAQLPIDLFSRSDFESLKTFGEVPVRPLETPPSNPFK